MQDKDKTPKQLAVEYLQLPILPYKKNVVLHKIIALNFDPVTKKSVGTLEYSLFRQLRPVEFPACVDESLDYKDNELVSPVRFILEVDGAVTEYRTPMKLWFPLTDIVSGIMKKQTITGKKILPHTLYLDEKDQWLVTLMNLVGIDLL